MPRRSAQLSKSKRRILRSFRLEILEERRLLSGTTTLRIVTYNIESDIYSQGIVAPPEPAFATVLEAIGAENVSGDSQPIDILALQETSGNTLTAAPIVSALNGYYGAGTYAYCTFQPSTTGQTDGNGPNALIYNTTTVTLVGVEGIGTPSDGGYPRQPVRYEFQPVNGSAADDFYVYDSHYKSGDETVDNDGARRQAEAEAIVADAATLPANARILYVGDYNCFSATDPGYATITAPGPNQGFDPINQPVFRNGPLQTMTETDTALEERLDFELPTNNVLTDPTGGLYLVPGSYHVFGNDGSTRNVSEGSTALPGLPNRTTVLEDLTLSSDHLPVVADYTDTVTAPVGPAIGSLSVSPTSVSAGATVVLTANNVVEDGPGSIASVEFYRESNGIDGLQIGSDAPVGSGTRSGSNWTLSVSTSGLSGGSYTYYAVATDNASQVSNPVSTTLSVSGPATPTIGTFTASPSSVVAGATVTLDAGDVTQLAGTISNVQFYSETNGTSGLQVGSDLFLGNGTLGGSDWIFNTDTIGLPTGTQTYYAVATNEDGVESATAMFSVNITAPQPPSISSFTVSPSSVVPGTLVTLSADDVTAYGSSSVAYVNFYVEDNGVPGLQTDTDSLVAAGTNQNNGDWTASLQTSSLTPGTYTYYAVATDSNDQTGIPLSQTLTVAAPQPTLANLQILASASASGPFTSTLSVTPSENVYFEVIAQLAPVGTTDGSYTITSLNPATDGINSLSFNLLDQATSTLPISFATPTLAAPWGNGIGAKAGTPQSVGGGTNNEISTARPIQSPGVFSGALSSVLIESGSFVVGSSVPQGGISQVAGSFAGATSSIKINGGTVVIISTNSESGSAPIMGIAPLTLSLETLPAWLAPGSAVNWNSSTKTLTVTGAATIIADPGSDSPNIVASGTAANLTINPAIIGFVNLGGITLTDGASITVQSVGASRTHTYHNVIVLDSNGTSVPTFSIDSSSKLDLQDNDMIIENGGSELSTVQGLAQTGADYPNNDWTGDGLTSSVAESNDANQGYEQTLLAVALNGSLPSGPFTSWQAGSGMLALGPNDVIVKYTYNGDFNLDGMVDDSDAGLLSAFYAPGVPYGAPGTAFEYGDTNGDGYVDDSDAGLFGVLYGLGTGDDGERL
ncbi:MAG: endonuclease/exonuclease/phosphatase family protein [Isosphaeraceae bacterium]